MEIAAAGASLQVLAWIGTLLAAAALLSLVFIALVGFGQFLDHRRSLRRKRHSDDPDHPVPLFPPYQGL
jgi:hypothetical protein